MAWNRKNIRTQVHLAGSVVSSQVLLWECYECYPGVDFFWELEIVMTRGRLRVYYKFRAALVSRVRNVQNAPGINLKLKTFSIIKLAHSPFNTNGAKPFDHLVGFDHDVG